jgi:putative two-component system response regulator
LRAYYKVTPLIGDSYLQVCTEQELPELILLTISSFHTKDLSIYNDLMNIPEMIGTPVIFLVKSGNLELAQQMLEMGAQDYILLPITPELLHHRISNFLELMNLRKERPFVEKYEDAISLSFAELVECRDLTTGGHLKNTRRYFQVLLEEAMASDQYRDQLPVEDTNELLRSVILHDIGKIGINDEVLRKESSLDFNEFEYMKTHTTLGKQAFENIISETGGVKWIYMARDMAYCHHERWDGTGYPNGLKGEEIPLSARILTIADVYDALTSNRAYKKAFSHEKATQIIIEGKGCMFDPDLVDLFMNVNEQFEEILNNRMDLESIERE